MTKRNSDYRKIIFAGMLVLLVLLWLLPPGRLEAAQDVTFRLMNIERRLDQLQIRVDSLERAYQSQTMTSTSGAQSNAQLLIELQRQQLSLAEQQVLMQRQMLDLQKRIDQMREKPAEEAKPKTESKPKAPGN